ncbi:hypothetical protein LTR15_010338 [Elasticomyces elasticus]|nr:hypothetical protein LTR15_010338 [Elasticomyces elasticus]
MLLVHQAGSVKVGELVRYTLTYTPSHDRILPTPAHLHVKVKNTSAIPLRAAWLRGPYVLHVATYPSTFNPHQKVEQPDKYGVPEYEPMLKAGGSWQSKLVVPDEIRETGADLGKRRVSSEVEKQKVEDAGAGSMTWIIEVTSQILFSTSASVNFEVLVGRDERSLDLGFAAVAGHGHGAPGQLKERQGSEKERKRAKRHGNVQSAGVYSKAVRLVAEDTETLWDKPSLPSWEEQPDRKPTDHGEKSTEDSMGDAQAKRRKKLHLVILTHGLHSNISADMLFMKESIDATVKQARMDAKERKAKYRQREAERKGQAPPPDANTNQSKEETSTAPLSGGQEELDGGDEGDEDEEETIVRGFTGNAIRTENGIQYLGKRLAKYILRFTYPDQPFLPVKKPLGQTLTDTFKSDADKARRDGQPSHSGSSVHNPSKQAEELPYKFTSISFVGHSLGGLVQTYAIAYIHKHSPTFFQQIKPVNFICMASPMLGLSNENPLYVKFALDFGLVGKTGQDLGLTWRPNTLARGGWNAMIGGLGGGVGGSGKEGEAKEDPGAKPLLRILPTGPAHQVLRMFRNRTLYSNVVNDGIVPLRTSCLLFLDWRGLGKVDKARRENGLIGTVAAWGIAELTGANSATVRPNVRAERVSVDESGEEDEHVLMGQGEMVPQPGSDETAEDNRLLPTHTHSFGEQGEGGEQPKRRASSLGAVPPQQDKGMLASFMDFFTPKAPERAKTPPPTSKKTSKALRRGQTIRAGEDELADEVAHGQDGAVTTDNPTMRHHNTRKESGQVHHKRPIASRGDSMQTGEMQAPPKSSIFESAADILHPPLPSTQWLTDPGSRARTIFHDRVYHPEDIPPPPLKRPGSRLTRSFSSDGGIGGRGGGGSREASLSGAPGSGSVHDDSAMKVEEKIARAYHKDLSWRKVLVRLEPDAHNNMIVRRMFANAYGWPVVKHLCDTHFGDSYSARTRDEEEPARERAKPLDEPVSADGGERVEGQTQKGPLPERSMSEMREERDELRELKVGKQRMEDSWSSKNPGNHSGGSGTLRRQDSMGSVVWDDTFFEGSEDDEDGDEVDERTLVQRLINPHATPAKPEAVHHSSSQQAEGSGGSVVPVSPITEGHRGLGPRSPGSMSLPRTPKTAHKDAPTTPVLNKTMVEEPQSLEPASPGSTSELGLRKSIHGQVLEASTVRKASGSDTAGR